VALLLVQTICSGVLAVDNINDVNQAIEQQQTAADGGSNVWLDLLKLLFILVLILGAAWSVVRFLGQKSSKRMQGKWMQVVDEVMLSNNRGIVLCRTGDRVYALGITDHNISLLFEVDSSVVLEEIGQYQYTLGEKQTDIDSWKKLFSGLVNNRKFTKKKTNEFKWLMEEQVQRLEKMNLEVRDGHTGGGNINDENE
jgi:flagellar protein FliO/FliZ